MAKTIKISLVIDGCKCRSIEDVRNNFNLMEVVDNFQSGKLLKWAKSRENTEIRIWRGFSVSYEENEEQPDCRISNRYQVVAVKERVL